MIFVSASQFHVYLLCIADLCDCVAGGGELGVPDDGLGVVPAADHHLVAVTPLTRGEQHPRLSSCPHVELYLHLH